MMNITPTVKQLLIINIIFFIGAELVPGAKALLSLFNIGSDNFAIWQPLTHMFMHGDIMHIAFNMFGLYMFGSALEHFWGSGKFLFFYISCGLGAAALQLGINHLEIQSLLESVSSLNLSESTLHQILNATVTDGHYQRRDLFLKELEPIVVNAGKVNLINPENFEVLYNAASQNQIKMVGASGAIYGLMVAFAFMFPNTEFFLMFVPIPIKAKYFVPGMLLIDLFAGITGRSILDGGSNVAHFAHIGGALIGLIMMWYWKKNQFNRNRWN